MNLDHSRTHFPYTGRFGSKHDAFRDHPPSSAPLYERASYAYETPTLVASQIPSWVPQFHTRSSGYSDLDQDSAPSCSLPSIQDGLSSLTASNFGSLGWAHHTSDMDVCHPSPSAAEIVARASRSPSPNPSINSATSSQSPAEVPCLEQGCKAMFSGKYRRGNLARHMRLKHVKEAGERLYFCEECGKAYHRQDARLKHYRRKHCRKKHSEVASAPL